MPMVEQRLEIAIHDDIVSSEIKHLMVISFEILIINHQPVYWVKMDRIACMMKSMCHKKVPKYFSSVNEAFVHASPDGYSTNKKVMVTIITSFYY